jgi:hypothetical protein
MGEVAACLSAGAKERGEKGEQDGGRRLLIMLRHGVERKKGKGGSGARMPCGAGTGTGPGPDRRAAPAPCPGRPWPGRGARGQRALFRAGVGGGASLRRGTRPAAGEGGVGHAWADPGKMRWAEPR